MRFSLPLRLFVLQLLFAVAAGAVVYLSVEEAFNRYYQDWAARIDTVPAEQLYQGFANEVGRSLLLRLRYVPEVQQRDRERIGQGLNVLLKDIPSIESIVIVDANHRIQYAKDTSVIDLKFTGDAAEELFGSDEVVRRTRTDGVGGPVTEVMYPIFDAPTAGGGRGRRLGSLLVVYRPDPALAARLPKFEPPKVRPARFFNRLGGLFLALVAGAMVMSALTVLPVRRLDRALSEFRARGFRGRIDVDRLGLGGELASAVRAINEMGGKLEALDSRGREREALLATLSRSLEDGMIALDASRSPVAWNDAALRLLGFERRVRSEALAAGGEGESAFRDSLRERLPALGLGQADRTVASREIEVQHGDGRKVPVQVTAVPFEMRPGEQGTLLLLRDLAALRLVETHLLEAGRFAVLAHLAGSLAHEIRNPLHSIGLNAGVVEQYVDVAAGEGSRQAMHESLRTIQQETRRLTELLNNYLGLLSSSPEPALVDLREVCRRVIQLLSYAAMRSRVDIRLEGDEAVPEVHGVPDRLQQAVLNLVLNAIQAMPQGGVVALRLSRAGGMVRLTVQDTGPGLPEGVAEHLFESRVTTKPGGSGLGLPLVRLIAEAHGGAVWYRSDPGKGAAFTLVLPGATEAAA